MIRPVNWVRVLGKKVRVLRRQDTEYTRNALGRGELKGGYISYISNMPPDTANSTQWHEINHYILDDLGLHDNVDEAFVSSFSSATFAFIKDNPKFIEQIFNAKLKKE